LSDRRVACPAQIRLDEAAFDPSFALAAPLVPVRQ